MKCDHLCAGFSLTPADSPLHFPLSRLSCVYEWNPLTVVCWSTPSSLPPPSLLFLFLHSMLPALYVALGRLQESSPNVFHISSEPSLFPNSNRAGLMVRGGLCREGKGRGKRQGGRLVHPKLCKSKCWEGRRGKTVWRREEKWGRKVPRTRRRPRRREMKAQHQKTAINAEAVASRCSSPCSSWC